VTWFGVDAKVPVQSSGIFSDAIPFIQTAVVHSSLLFVMNAPHLLVCNVGYVLSLVVSCLLAVSQCPSRPSCCQLCELLPVGFVLFVVGYVCYMSYTGCFTIVETKRLGTNPGF